MSSRVDEINSFLDAFSPAEVKEALKRRNARRLEDRLGTDWKPWTGEGLPPRPYEWRKVNNTIQYREPGSHAPPSGAPKKPAPARPKTREALTPLLCPACGAGMYKEGVCASCEDGKAGYKIRLLCGECDHVELL